MSILDLIYFANLKLLYRIQDFFFIRKSQTESERRVCV